MASLVRAATVFAERAHGAHIVTDTWIKGPYIFHLIEVATLVEKAKGSPEEVAAAMLHGITKNPTVTFEAIRRYFGNDVTRMVEELKDPPEFSRLTLSARKLFQALRAAEQSESIQRIKIADQISNVRFIESSAFDLKIRRAYIEGSRRIVHVSRAASPKLAAQFDEAYRLARLRLQTVKI